MPVVTVLPSAPVGPGDWHPTPTGAMIVAFLQGRIRGALPGGLNLVAVEDVARGHLLALERGRPGQRYLLGSENLSLSQLWALLGSVSGLKAAQRQIPYWAAMAFAGAEQWYSKLIRSHTPLAPLEGVRMGRERMFIDHSKARAELGFEPGPVRPALERAVGWYRRHGYV